MVRPKERIAQRPKNGRVIVKGKTTGFAVSAEEFEFDDGLMTSQCFDGSLEHFKSKAFHIDLQQVQTRQVTKRDVECRDFHAHTLSAGRRRERRRTPAG